jgi:hypothetical protein
LFLSVGQAGRSLWVGAIDGSSQHRLVDADSGGVYLRGHVFFQRGGMLIAQPFDLGTLQVIGAAQRVAPTVMASVSGYPGLTVSAHGAIAYRSGASSDRRQLTWFDREGRVLRTMGEATTADNLRGVALSPDEQRVLASRQIDGNSDLWAFELTRDTWTRITKAPTAESQGVWLPNGRQLAFISSRKGSPDVYMRDARPGEDDSETLLVASDELKGAEDASPDGRYLIFGATVPGGNSRASYTFEFATRKIVPVAVDAVDAQISPDGNWIAYESNQSSQPEIFVQPFPSGGDRVQVSRDGGTQARWRGDGHELFYVSLDERLMSVRIDTTPDQAAKPIALFPVRVPNGPVQPGGWHQQYDVSKDGKRFLVNTRLPDENRAPISVIFNWKPK